MKKIVFGIVVLSLFGYAHAKNMTPDEINEQVIHADDSTANIGFKFGTLGAGIDISKPYNNWISLRLNANGFNYNATSTSDYSSLLKSDKEYKLQTIGILADFHLLQLRVTAGIYLNNNKITDITKPKEKSALYLDGISYSIDSITEVQNTVTFKKVSPYVGIGWGNNGNREGWNMTLDVGLMYHGDPQLDLTVITKPGISSLLSNQIDNAAKAETQKQLKNLSDFPFYPVVMIGFNYSF